MKYSKLKDMTDKEIKQSLLETFKDVISFCEEHNLRYVMAYGTLLGSIRHKGFIPWDLDMDINMPRPDYNYFLKNFVSKNKHSEIFDSTTNPKFFMSFTKVSDSRTICDEHYKGFKKKPYGVSIDIFPIDGIDEDKYPKTLKQANKLTNILYMNRIKPNAKFPLKYNIGFIFSNIAFAWWPYTPLVKKIHKLCSNTSYEEATMVAGISEGSTVKRTFKKEVFEDVIWGEFEGIKCKNPAKYDEVLTAFYGDYMTPPAPDNRIDNHTFNTYKWK